MWQACRDGSMGGSCVPDPSPPPEHLLSEPGRALGGVVSGRHGCVRFGSC